jgi:hypothetical protein
MTWTSPKIWEPQKWEAEKDGIKVNATYQVALENELEQTITQLINLKVNDNGKEVVLEDKETLKFTMPQELKSIVELQGDFEFIGFFERNSLIELADSDPNNLIVLRKR